MWDFLQDELYSGKPTADQLKTVIAQEVAGMPAAHNLQQPGERNTAGGGNAAVPICSALCQEPEKKN